MPPPLLSQERREVVEEMERLSTAQGRLQFAAGCLGIVSMCIVLSVVALKTTPVECTYGVTRYFEVNPNIIVASNSSTATGGATPEGAPAEVKRVGGVRQTIRALQIALELPMIDIPAGSSSQSGQWWSVANASRTMVDTPFGDLQKRNLFLVQEHGSNVTRLIATGLDLCNVNQEQLPEPSISTDTDSYVTRLREWKRCLPPLPSLSPAQVETYIGAPVDRFDTVSTATVRITSPKRRRFRTSADVARLFPQLREVVTQNSPNELEMQAFAHGYISVAVLYNGFVGAQVAVVMDRPADPILNPKAVRSIVVTLDPRVRSHTDDRDVAMRRVSHHAQQLLGRAVINFEASRQLDMTTVALLTQ